MMQKNSAAPNQLFETQGDLIDRANFATLPMGCFASPSLLAKAGF